MRKLNEKQQTILDYLLGRPDGANLKTLADMLATSLSATKEHILKLEHLGYIHYKDSKGLIGRPKRTYLLTESGQEVFPKQYAWIAIMLLELIAEKEGPNNITKLMLQLADKVSKSLQKNVPSSASNAERFSIIVKILNDLGYRSNLIQSDLRKGAIIEATNCVYHAVAKKHPQLCQFDTRLIESLSGQKARLEQCIAKGGTVCRFCIK